MRIFASKYPYSRLRIDSPMDHQDKPEQPKISGGLQLMIALEVIPYFTTVITTSVLVSNVLEHPELEWSDVFAWRCASFAGFTFVILSMANYGDRVMNGRFYLFLMFSAFSVVCVFVIFFATREVAFLVFACCMQPLLIVRDASRLCYIVQILRASERSPKIRSVCFLLFLMANLGAFFNSWSITRPSMDPTVKIWGCVGCLSFHALLSVLVFVFGSNVVAHRNIVERGFRCVIWKFLNFVRFVMRKLCKLCCRKDIKDKDYKKLLDAEIITCVDCMLKMSSALFPVLLYFATVEMTFFTWVRDYDIFMDLGFQDWPMSLADVYHAFNVVSVLTIYVIMIPLAQCFISIPDLAVICLSYFALCLSWVTAASLQYGNELRQTHYAIANESKIVIFSGSLDQVLFDGDWSDRRWLPSGNFSVNYLRPTNSSDPVVGRAKLWRKRKLLPTAANPLTTYDIQPVSNPTFLIPMNSTKYYLVIDDRGLQSKELRGLNEIFDRKSHTHTKINGTLLTLCSTNLYASNATHYLVIQDLRTKLFKSELVCDSRKYDSLTNLTIGWYTLYLQENDQYVPFQMQVNVKKGAVHYLYIYKGNDTFAPYTGNFTNLVQPVFQIDKSYVLLQIGLFSLAHSMGMVAMHSFLVGATPKHLLEFGFAIFYSARALGSGLAAVSLSFVTSGSQEMFVWVVILVAGMLLMVRNAWVYVETSGHCGPEVKFTEDESEEESSSESEEDDESKKASASVGTSQGTEPSSEPAPQTSASAYPETKTRKWFRKREEKSSKSMKSPSPQERQVENSAPVTGKTLETRSSKRTPDPTLSDHPSGPS